MFPFSEVSFKHTKIYSLVTLILHLHLSPTKSFFSSTLSFSLTIFFFFSFCKIYSRTCYMGQLARRRNILQIYHALKRNRLLNIFHASSEWKTDKATGILFSGISLFAKIRTCAKTVRKYFQEITSAIFEIANRLIILAHARSFQTSAKRLTSCRFTSYLLSFFLFLLFLLRRARIISLFR